MRNAMPATSEPALRVGAPCNLTAITGVPSRSPDAGLLFSSSLESPRNLLGHPKDNHEADFETMSLTGRHSGVGALREQMCGPMARDDRTAVDPAKALVIAHLGVLVSDGYAEWSPLDDGNVELRFFSGEIFLLGASSITRIT
jgi:hypothetical protein